MLYQLLERSEQFITEKLARNQTLELKKYILVYSEDINEFNNTVRRLKKADKGLREITKVMISRPNIVKRQEVELLPCSDKDKLTFMKG
ncbi:MAG: hypothetical protein EBU90_26015 [Proteobacteria bacterium]|jgi:hypothetical protein|nr:hypothetical protein [Pseudomonadota bacterium]